MGNETLEATSEEIARLIVQSQRIVVFTGAGISTESGIPDFRGPDGLWTKVDPSDFTYQKFVGDREVRKRIWQLNTTSGFAFGGVEPNLAHRAIAELEKLGKLDCVITQNVDGLHQKAGNSEDKVLQLHGNMQWVKCIGCGVRHRFEEVRQWIEGGVEVPECLECGGILKPDAVFFGEAMPVRETAEAERRSSSCDLCIVIGSTLVVYPAGLMPQYAVDAGAKLVIINDGETALDHLADVRIAARAGEVMSLTMEKLKEKLGADS
jgi:NAD-dependent deacetylase